MSLASDTIKIVASRGASRPLAVQVIRHEVIAPDVVTLSLAQPGARSLSPRTVYYIGHPWQ